MKLSRDDDNISVLGIYQGQHKLTQRQTNRTVRDWKSLIVWPVKGMFQWMVETVQTLRVEAGNVPLRSLSV